MYSIIKEMKFEASHRLVQGYQGKCAHVHGHSWVVRVKCSGSKLDEFGMLRDFGSLKTFRDWIDDRLDHATLVNEADKDLLQFLQQHEQRYYMCQGNPTSEYLARMLYEHLHTMGFLDVVAVEIDETCTSKAIYEPTHQ